MSQTTDYDYAIREIRRKMHDPRGSKAAVMVGAGFSRNALAIRSSGQRSFPDWAALTMILVDRLYSDPSARAKVLKSSGATSSALRLAEEFESAHGRPALIDVIRESIRDNDFTPSQVHEDLMALPWADVFTTNYDTLLERGALQHSRQVLRAQRYDLVLDSSDLPIARRPRIVKLHGTLPDLTNLILTEEDFRRYPFDHAPFVNAVLTSLTENIFCLVGFSGDDPNFLAWTGWIRDVLKTSSPPIYLFRGSALEPFQRKLLEQRNIIPLPICDISGRQSLDDAFKWLFDELAKEGDEPTAPWNLGPAFVDSIGTKDSSTILEPRCPAEPTKELCVSAALQWRHSRRQYKGWHILYRTGITRLWALTDRWDWALKRTYSQGWQPYECIFYLREYLWRLARALQPVPDDLVEHMIDPSLAQFERWEQEHVGAAVTIESSAGAVALDATELIDAVLYILLELLRHAREIGDGSRFSSLVTRLETRLASAPADIYRDERQFITHQRILWTLARFEHDHARSLLVHWHTTDADDIWAIRRAGLMLECGQRELGAPLLTKVLDKIRATRTGSEIDYAMRSAEGVALHILWYVSRHVALTAPIEPTQVENRRDNASQSSFDIDRPLAGGYDLKKDGGPVVESPVRETPLISVPEEATILRRLKELSDLGCNPYDMLDWLRLQNEDKRPAQSNVEEHDAFEPGRVSRTYHSGNQEPLQNAYRAIRFIEEAALPLTIHDTFGSGVCNALYANASRVIASVAAREGIGLVLRSRDSKLVETFLSRSTLTSLSHSQVMLLKDVGLAALRRTVQRLTVLPLTFDAETKWWEEQFEVAVAILGRIVVILGNSGVDDIVTDVVQLAGNTHIVSRFRIARDCAVFIRRSIESLSQASAKRFLPALLDVSVPGSPGLSEQVDIRSEWFDPVGALMPRQMAKAEVPGPGIDNALSALLAEIKSASGKYRERLVLRAVSLWFLGLLSRADQQEFADALFARTDDLGFPSDTGCYDSLILGLPRRRDINENAMFRNKYVSTDGADDAYWNNLKRSVNRFGPPRSSKNRSIKWSRADLAKILEVAKTWLHSFTLRRSAEESMSGSAGFAFASFAEHHREEMAEAYRSWLEVIEEVVLLAPNVTQKQVTSAVQLLDIAKDAGLETIKVMPTLVCLKRLSGSRAVSSITGSLLDRHNESVWQACCGIARWSELTRAGHLPVIPEKVLTDFGLILAERRHERLALLLNTAKDIVEIRGMSCGRQFVAYLMAALKQLAPETAYKSSITNLSVGQKIQLRAIATELAWTLLKANVKGEPLAEWMNLVGNDIFSEVRLSLKGVGNMGC